MGNKGVCFGVSVGPGDPELITKKAYDLINKADIIFLPSSPKEECRVYQIIKAAMPDINEDRFICIDTAKMADPKIQGERYDILANEVIRHLENNKMVAFPALGEVCLYSTYMYVHNRLMMKGYETRLISGISSIQEIADRLGIPLAIGDEQVTIYPDTNDINEKLSVKGTKIFMKPKGDLKLIVNSIEKYVKDHPQSMAMGISNCGTVKEIIAKNISELPNLRGYMTVLIVRQNIM